MPPLTETIPNLSGGFCTTPTELVDCAALTNCVINRDGSVQGRPGYFSYGTGMTGSPVYIFKGVISSNPKVIIQGTTNMWLLVGTNWVSKGIFGALPNLVGSMCQFGDHILACSSTYGVILWDGGAGNFVAVAGSPAAATHLAADQSYVYACDQHGNLYWSDSGDPHTWPADHVLPIGGEQDIVHDMIFLFGKLYIFRESGIWCKTGFTDSEFQLFKITNDRCYSKVAAGVDGIYLFNLCGVQKFDGSTCHRISAKIDDTTLLPNTNGQFIHYQYGQRRLFIPTDTECYVYDELLDRWMKWTISGMLCAAELDPASGVVFGIKNSSTIYKGFSGTTDNGVAITTTITTKANIDFGTPELLKRMKHIYVDGTLTSTTMTLKSNYGATTEKTFTSPGRLNFCVPGGKPQRNFQVSFSGVQGTLLRSLKLVANPVTL